jgi:hypothetical protein
MGAKVSGSRKHKKKLKRLRPLKRKDMITRMLVDIGLSYAPTLGNPKASDFLRVKAVPEHVIVRVMQGQQTSILDEG